jgi:hypothetical protein
MISDLQSAVAARLLNLVDYGGPAGLDPVTEQLGDIETEIRKRIDKAGLGLVVITPKVQPGPDRDALAVDVVIGIAENRIQNFAQSGTQVSALDVAVAVIACLRHWQPGEQTWTPLEFIGLELVQPGPEIVYEVEFQTTTTLTVNP